jgi:hypothetical protein
MASPAGSRVLPDLFFGRRGIAKVVHVWLPVGVLLSLDPPANPVSTLRAVACVLIAAGCFAQVSILVNDLCDRREDEAAGKDRRIGKLPVPGAIALLALTAGLGAGLALAAGQGPALLVYGVSLALGVAYSVPPLRLKTRGMVGPAAYAAATAAAYVLLPGVVFKGAPGVLGALVAVVFLDKLAHLLHHQVTDHDADRQSDTRTLAVVAGPVRVRTALRLIAWLAILLFAALPVLLAGLGPRWVAGAAGLSVLAGLSAAVAISRGASGSGAAFARELPPLYLGLGFSSIRLLPVLLLAGVSGGVPLLWPVFLAAAATALAELLSYGQGLHRGCGEAPACPREEACDGRLLRWLAVAGVAVAIGVRVLLLGDKPFWRDEAWVADISRGTVPAILSSTMPTPVGFVLLAKLTGQLPGLPPEISLRLAPLLCGLAAVVALPRLARALGATPTVALTVLLLAAGSPPLVYYSRELKHYGADLLLAILVPLLAIRLFGLDAEARERDPPGAGMRPLLVALVVAPWVSFASAFPIVAALLWGWLLPWRRATVATRRRWAVLSLLYGLSLAIALVSVIERQAQSPSLVEFWGGTFAQRAALPWLARIGHAGFDFIRGSLSYFFPGMEPIALALAVIGLATWPKPRAATLWCLTAATLLLTVTAVLAQRYVLAEGRFLLFFAPPLLLSVAAGLAAVGRLLQRVLGGRCATAAPLVVGAVAALWWSTAAVAHRLPPYRDDRASYFRYDILHDVEPLIAAAARRAGPAEPVLVSFLTGQAFGYYARGRLPGATVLTPPIVYEPLPGILRAWSGTARGWILLLASEAPVFDRAVSRGGFERSLAASARGSQLWEVRRREASGLPASLPPL